MIRLSEKITEVNFWQLETYIVENIHVSSKIDVRLKLG